MNRVLQMLRLPLPAMSGARVVEAGEEGEGQGHSRTRP